MVTLYIHVFNRLFEYSFGGYGLRLPPRVECDQKGEKGKGKFARRSRGGILFAKVTAWPKKYS
jgi:hypothetical protein